MLCSACHFPGKQGCTGTRLEEQKLLQHAGYSGAVQNMQWCAAKGTRARHRDAYCTVRGWVAILPLHCTATMAPACRTKCKSLGTRAIKPPPCRTNVPIILYHRVHCAILSVPIRLCPSSRTTVLYPRTVPSCCTPVSIKNPKHNCLLAFLHFHHSNPCQQAHRGAGKTNAGFGQHQLWGHSTCQDNSEHGCTRNATARVKVMPCDAHICPLANRGTKVIGDTLHHSNIDNIVQHRYIHFWPGSLAPHVAGRPSSCQVRLPIFLARPAPQGLFPPTSRTKYSHLSKLRT